MEKEEKGGLSTKVASVGIGKHAGYNRLETGHRQNKQVLTSQLCAEGAPLNKENASFHCFKHVSIYFLYICFIV